MGKRKGDQPNSQAQDVAGSEPEKIGPPSPLAEALSKIEAPELVPAASIAAAPADPVTPPAGPVDVAASPAAPPLPPVAKIAAPKAQAAAGAPPVAPAEPTKPAAIPLREQATYAAATSWTWLKSRPVTPLAASIAIAAVVGAMAGSVATAGLGGLWASPSASASAPSADARPMNATIARINTELAALKASIEHSGRNATAQFSKLGDRLDRVERAQAEPAAKLAKLAEAVNKLEHVAPAATKTGNDVTGSIAAPKPQDAAMMPARPAGPPVIDGWVVRSVYNGAALIQARYGGVIEVEPGDSLPQLGRIETIRRQDGRWVVLTSRGMIVAR